MQQTTDYLNLKLLIHVYVGILQVLRFDFKKIRILETLNFQPWFGYGLWLWRFHVIFI